MTQSPAFAPMQLRGQTFHARKGDIRNAFRYGVDYVLVDMAARAPLPWLFSRNRGNLAAIHDRDHGGAPGQGQGVAWVHAVLRAHGMQADGMQADQMQAADLPWAGRILLLTQPRILGHVFNPVSFWLIQNAAGALIAVIAEVSNTYGDRHSYLCRHPDLRPIGAKDRLSAEKLMHVSPFQPIAGGYEFRFDISESAVAIIIDFGDGAGGGVVATLQGDLRAMSSLRLLAAAVRRPFGSRRVLGLIHWQALKLWWKGAQFRSRPAPPAKDLSP